MIRLKYGMNPHQARATVEAAEGRDLPVQVLNGAPSMVNFLDALNGWQLVREARAALGLPVATSFKHVSPAGVALGVALDPALAHVHGVESVELSAVATAYVRARGADPKCSFGDFVALSDEVDRSTADYLRTVVSDGIIAPSYAPGTLDVLRAKKSGAFVVLQVDSKFEPPPRETREVFGMRLVQDRNGHRITRDDLAQVKVGELPEEAIRDLLLGLITLKYTQSNSVGFAAGGQTIGIGAGQQSRIDCTKLAGSKADAWQLSRHPKVRGLRFRPDLKTQDRINWRVQYIEGDLTTADRTGLRDALVEDAEPLTHAEKRAFLSGVSGVSMVSDGFIPFPDNVEHAATHGVRYVAEPGGSSRSGEVEAACRQYGIALVHTNLRLFHH